MRSRSYLFLGVVVLLAALSGFLFQQRPFNYGLDVEGGVRLTYQLDFTKLDKDTTKAEAQNRVVSIMENRAVGSVGVVEPSITKKGTDQIIVELPGKVSIEKAREVMGTTARLEWYHATNLQTKFKSFNRYTETDSGNTDRPEVWFTDTRGNKTIKPGDPEYQAIISGWTLLLSGPDLQNAYGQPVPDGYEPHFTFTPQGGTKLEQWSRANFNRGEKLAAVLDGVVLSVAPLADGAVLGQQTYIQGRFSGQYVRDLSALLKSGALPVGLKEIESYSVDPTIGKFALNQIVTVGFIAFAIIALFLIAYYVFPGFVALISLLLYVLFTLTVLKMVNATFSLAAIAGFILSVGMAVDANILVFERVKEELREGRDLMRSIELGFKRAFSAILDSNACTIITSFVLSSLGTGPVKGFASTLIIGVAISLFTAVVITRSLLVFLVGSGLGSNPKWYGLSRGWFGEKYEAQANEKPFRVVEKSKTFFLISVVTIIPGLIFLGLGGIKPNVEFSGGYEASYVVSADANANTIRQQLKSAGLEDANVKFADGMQDGRQVRLALLTIPSGKGIPADDPKDTPEQAQKKIEEAKQKIAGAVGVDPSKFTSSSFVGGTIRNETITNALLGVLISSLGIVFYLAIRFGFALGGFMIGLRFAWSVIAALIHDVLVVIGLAAMAGYFFGWEISALFISAMLTVIGFSTHDTIVIFDRIRENLGRPLPGEDMAFLINRSITQSFARSINTSMTVIATLGLLIAFGSASPDLRLFNAAMLAGIVSGTYSSIFNAAPILYLWDTWVGKKRGEQNTMIQIAKQASARTRLTRPAEVVPDGPSVNGEAAPAGYGQTRRRRRASDVASRNLDDEP